MKKYVPHSFLSIAVLATFLTIAPMAFADDPTVPTASDASVTTVEATPVSITLVGSSNDSGTLTFATTTPPTNGTLDTISGSSVNYTPNTGFIGTDSFQFIATEGATTSLPATATITVTAPGPDTATITIRDGATILGPYTVTLPDVNASDISVTPNTGATTTALSVPARSVLSALESLEVAHPDFLMTDIHYYDFGLPYNGGLYLNCVAVPATNAPDCAKWQYNVNNSTPFDGVGAHVLENGDNVYLYYEYPRQVVLSSNSVTAGTQFTATAESYDYTTNTFSPILGVTVGVTQPDPNDPFNPTEIATSTVDGNGSATFTLSNTGSYGVGIKEDFYFPLTTLTINAPIGSGGGSGSGGITHTQLNVPSALAYLSSKQNADGSFNASLYSDWAAIAFAAADPGSAKTKLKNYLQSATPALSSTTDYERHAMALEALGIDPYSGTSINYIASIIAAFDGTQIGIASEDNDDIFGLLALLHAGYAANDSIIQKEIVFILSKQRPDGSWDESPDLTAAGIQALGPLLTTPSSAAALGQAAGYLASQEKSDGSWSTIDATSWVQTAINAIIEAHTPGFDTENPWLSSGGYYPTDTLALAQQSDGAVRSASDSVDNRVWSTSYAVVAAAGKNWITLLQSFSKPVVVSGSGGGGSTSSATTTAATSTNATTTTTTLAVATSTSPVIATSTTTPLVTIESTTTLAGQAATTTAPVTPPKKKTVIHPNPKPVPATPTASAPVTEQTASAAAVAPDGFLGNLWHAVTSFFAWVF